MEEIRNYFIKEIDQNELIINKHSKVCVETLSISAFASLLGIPIGITSSEIGLKICAITAGIKNNK